MPAMEPEAKMRMKEWLVAQIESGTFEGLCWEDEAKTMFRIPWKHAAKKDYKQTADAALFKVIDYGYTSTYFLSIYLSVVCTWNFESVLMVQISPLKW